jgi:hypothetical protein
VSLFNHFVLAGVPATLPLFIRLGMKKFTHTTFSLHIKLITGGKSPIPNPMSTEISIHRNQLVHGTPVIHGSIISQIVVQRNVGEYFEAADRAFH